MLPKMLLVDSLARRRGFTPIGGRWYKAWPSGVTWSFTLDGRRPLIADAHGRELRTEFDGLTVPGMLHRST